MPHLEASLTRRWAGLGACLLASATLVLAAAPAHAETRYSIANGCYTLTSASSGQAAPGTNQSRMKATRLGSYMLYGPMRDFLAAGAGNGVTHATAPGPAADWEVGDVSPGVFTLSPASARDRLLAVVSGNLVLVPRAGAGASSQFRFTPADGCAEFPEAELNVNGTPAKGSTPYGEVQGLFDGHMHWMTYEYFGGNFHCGRPWSPYGIPTALPDCASIEGPLGAAAPFQNFLNFGQPVAPHSTAGWPTLDSFSRTNVTYEGTYYRWLQRTWAAGLRLIAMPINENRVLCELQTNRKTGCDEMATVYRGLDDVEALQDYVDAQAGGPGEGFFQIVRDPVEARRVINQGKMAVVEEVEISEPFGCMGTDERSTCDRAQVDAGLDKLYSRGVRSMLLLNKFDNPLTGVRFDSGTISPLLNAGNKVSAGSFWSAQSCDGPHDNSIESGGVPSGFLSEQVAALGVAPGSVPAYPPAPHCNTRGLTDLGRHVVDRMMNMGMIVNPDHMSQRAVDQTITEAEKRHYSGVISPHGWMDPRNWPRIYNLGGMAFPDSNSSEQFVADWHKYRPAHTPFYSGWAYGADLGGLAEQPESLPLDSPDRVTYPFKSLDGSVTVERQRTGQRTFDYPTEGVAHYGLYADWIEEVRKLGGPGIAADMLRGPEAYLQMWERSVGIHRAACREEKIRFSRFGLADIHLNAGPRDLLKDVGQPLSRTRAWTYCVKGRKNASKTTTAVLTPEGRVALVASTAPGHTARKIGPGTRLKRLRRLGARRGHKRTIKNLGKGVWVSRLGKTRVAYVVRRKKVRTVAVAGPAARTRAGLRQYLALVPPDAGAKTRTRARDVAVPGTAPVTARNAVPLKMQESSAALSMVCGASFQAALRGQAPPISSAG